MGSAFRSILVGVLEKAGQKGERVFFTKIKLARKWRGKEKGGRDTF